VVASVIVTGVVEYAHVGAEQKLGKLNAGGEVHLATVDDLFDAGGTLLGCQRCHLGCHSCVDTFFVHLSALQRIAHAGEARAKKITRIAPYQGVDVDTTRSSFCSQR
jgi:hypothetical protein